MGDFAAAIDPALLGLTGTAEEVDAAAKAYKVYYRKAGDDPEYYLMDHSTFTYLMAPGVGFLEFYQLGRDARGRRRLGRLLRRGAVSARV